MKTILTLLFGVLLIGLSLFLASCGETDAKEDTGNGRQQEQAVTVRVEEVALSPFTDVLPLTGILKASEDVMLSPEEGGVVKEWLVKKGETVTKGQIIGILNDDVLRASYEAAEAQYKMADLNFQKQKEVYKEKAISELQYRNLQYSRDAARAQADLMKARFERTRLRSPINGVLNDRFVDEGEFAPPGAPVAHIVNLSTIKIQAEITERYANDVNVGSPVTVVPDAFPNDTLRGRVIFVGASVSASNRTLPVEIHLPNPGLQLKPEMISRVFVLRSQNKNAILVSEDILQQIDRGKTVVFVEKNGVAEERVVKIGGRKGTMVEVVTGLNPGDRIIVSGYRRLVNGQPVVVAG